MTARWVNSRMKNIAGTANARAIKAIRSALFIAAVYLCLLASALPLLGQSCTTAVCNAAGVSQAQVLAALPSTSNTNATVVVNIPSGTATWSSALNYTVPSAVTNLTIQGATTVNCTGTAGASNYLCTATDSTIIVDGVATGGTSLMTFALGSNASLYFRLTGISLTGAGTGGKYNGEIQIASGASQNVRIDHNHFSDLNYSNSTKFFLSNAAIAGVADHNAVYMQKFWQNDNGFVIQGPYNDGSPSGDGDFTFANPTLWGSLHTFYVESNYVLGGYLDDCAIAGAIALRYNYFDSPGALLQTHGTKSDAFGRACRLAEAYHNYVTNSNGSSGDAFFGQKGSPVMVWGNTVGPHGGSSWFFDGCTDRSCGSTTETQVPNGWWYCGTSAPGNPGGTSPYDGNSSSATGYPCLDGIGRGQTQYSLNGQWFPNENMLNGPNAGTRAWPNQYLEPTYMFANNYGTLGNAVNIHDTSSTNNRDYYYDCGPLNSSCSSFNGTKGTGSGLLSARPSTCTAGPGGTYGASPTGSYGVGYFGTDTNTLYVCTATNTWTSIYQPYTYPHPLVSGSTQVPAPTFSPAGGAYSSAQQVAITDSLSGPNVVISMPETSNGNASTGTTPHANTYTNCIATCASGSPAPSPYGTLWCTAAIKASSTIGSVKCPAYASNGVVSSTISGTGTSALDNGNGAGGSDSPASVTATYGGTTPTSCEVGTNNPSALIPSLLLPGKTSNSQLVMGITTGSPGNSSILTVKKFNYNGDSANLLIRQDCVPFNSTTVSGSHYEWDDNYNDSAGTYFGFGFDFDIPNQKLRTAPQGASWTNLELCPFDGSACITTYAPPTSGQYLYSERYEHYTPGCSPTSGSACAYYDAICLQKWSGGSAVDSLTCYHIKNASTHAPISFIPISKTSWTHPQYAVQHQWDINASSSTLTANIAFSHLVAYNYSGLQIFYTNNGSTPTTSSTLYTLPVSVSTSQTLNALATAPSYTDSPISAASYTITAGSNYTMTITAPNATVAGTNNTSGTYASGTPLGAYTITPAAGYTITSITGTGSTSGCTSSPCGPYTLGANSSITVNTVQQTVATPTFSPGAGTYIGTQTVTISTATSGATLCYTTDGSTPTADGAGTCTHGTTYSTPVSVAASETLKAIGSKATYLDSSVGSAAYVINPVPTVQVKLSGVICNNCKIQ